VLRSFAQQEDITDTPTAVSNALSIDPGQYVVIGKLYATGPAIGQGAVHVTCELHQDNLVLDFAGASVGETQDVPVMLAGSAAVQDQPSALSIVCSTGAGGSATAFAVQLIATRVDSVGP
jgi:hypothetical protein